MKKEEKNLLGSLAILLLLLPGVAGCGGAADSAAAEGKGPVRAAPIRGYGVIWKDRLTRSGQPEEKAQIEWLRKQGVKSFVNLRAERNVDYSQYGFEKVLWIPLGEDGEPPTDAEAEEFLTFIQDPANWPVHMHCAAGRTRTGMMAALARYAVDGWSVDDALAEAKLYRGGEELGSIQADWLRRWAATHKPGPSGRK